MSSSLARSNLCFAAAGLVGLAVSLAPASAAIVYVKSAAAGSNSGTDWTNAYSSLQQALTAALESDEIWVAVGTYKPTSPAGQSATFQLRDNIAIYGGFRGLPGDEGISDSATRPLDPSPTIANSATDSILSGDLNDNDTPSFGNYADNAFHVATGNNTGPSAVLDGFTIAGGYANIASDTQTGGGMINSAGSPTIRRCNFLANFALVSGGAVYIAAGGNPVFERCTFSGNAAGLGAAVHNTSSQSRFLFCNFLSNSATQRGGAMASTSNSTINLVNCRVSANSASISGGAIHHDGGAFSLHNCALYANSSGGDGEALFMQNGAAGQIRNCTFLTNTGTSTGVIYETGAASTLLLRNSILWHTAAAAGLINLQVFVASGSFDILNCDLPGGIIGSISVEPYFTDPDGPDNLFGTLDDDFRVAPYSRCIDAGRNSDAPPDTFDLDGDFDTTEPLPFDLTGGPRFVDSPYYCDTGIPGNGHTEVVDIGASESSDAWPTPHRLYVNRNATGSGTGLTWSDALTEIYSATAVVDNWAPFCGSPTQVWIAAGTYKPTTGTSRTPSFNLRNNLAYFGGFGGSETQLFQRSPATNATILSGDIGVVGSTSDNSFHVVRSSNTDPSAILDGFTITGGSTANSGGVEDNGGGLLNLSGSPTIANCRFLANFASKGGGAVYSTGNPRFANCSFESNSAGPFSGQVYSGGAVLSASGTPSFANCRFWSNVATKSGGAIHCASAPVLGNAEFVANRAAESGGALYFDSGANPDYCNCLFAANESGGPGGAIYAGSGASNLRITNGSFVGNVGSAGGAVSSDSPLTLNNSILWYNSATSVAVGQRLTPSAQLAGLGSRQINYSSIQYLTPAFPTGGGVGNFSSDPRFATLPLGPDSLPPPGTAVGKLLSISSCIDRGSAALIPADVADVDADGDTAEPVPVDLYGNPRRYDVPDVPDGGSGPKPMVDIGACEFAATDPYVCLGGKCLGDLNHDFQVNGLDVQLFVNELLSGGCP